MEQDLATLLRGFRADLPRNQKRLADFALADPQAVAFSTITELAEQSGVSPATIVRFAKSLGFDGYNALQRELRRSMRAGLRGPDRFRRAAKGDSAPEGVLSPAIRKEMENIAGLQDYHDPDRFAQATQMIADASRIIVVGSRSAASLAHHCWFGLNKAGLAASRETWIDSHTLERIDALDEKGCVIAIGFPRYLAETARIIHFAMAAGKRVVVITDSPFSTLSGTVTLFAPVESSSFVAFHSAPLILISTLISEVASTDPERTLQALDRFEALAERQGLFMPTEMPTEKGE